MKRKLYKLTSMLLVLLMFLGCIPGAEIAPLFARAATNADSGRPEDGFQGGDSDIFSALGFDTTETPTGFNADETENPYGRDKMAFNVVSEILLANGGAYSVFGKNNNNVSIANINTQNPVKSAMPFLAVLSAGATGDFDGDGLTGEVAYVGLEKVDESAGKAQSLYLYVFDAKTGRYSNQMKIGEITPYDTAGTNQFKHMDRWQNLLQISAGDYDGDGIAEIAV